MKGLLGLKNKASTVVKERIQQTGGRADILEDHAALQRPFEETHSPGKMRPSTAEAGAGPANKESKSRSRSTSPMRPASKPTSGYLHADPVLEHIIHNARREAVKDEFLKTPADEYTAYHPLRVRAATYNVNGRMPAESLDLSAWLDPNRAGADIFAVGFQEIVPLNAQNVVIGASLDAASAWEDLIDTAINGQGEREAGHLVMRSQHRGGDAREQRKSFDAGPVDELKPESRARPSKLESRSNSPRLDSPRTDGQIADLDTSTSSRLQDSTSIATQISDDLEGYLSPADDTLSMFSDDASGPKPYVQVVAKQMVGIYITVWVRRALLRNIRGVQITSVGTGIMGYLGNKGAVAVRLRIFDSGLSFIVSHLSSGEQEGDEQKRNYDYSEIVRRGSFPADMQQDPESQEQGASESDAGPEIKVASVAKPGQWGSMKGLLENENVIWMGDLNYRLTLPDEEVRKAIKANNLAKLAEHDELTIARRKQQAFQSWEEGLLTFPPTFKFKRGTKAYIGDSEDDPEPTLETKPDAATSTAQSQPAQNPSGQKQEVEKRRTPAWTDRVLWRSQGNLKQLSYASANLTASDHMPVAATFTLNGRDYLRNKIESLMEAARRTVDARDMAAMPRCELEPLTVEAGIVTYAKEKLAHLILTNTGAVPAQWQFMSLPGAMFGDPQDQVDRPAPRWAKVYPEKGRLEPKQAVEITLTILVDGGQQGTAELLTASLDKKLDAILVLRVEDGNDVFCSIAGTFAPSFFGLSPGLLSTMARPLSSIEGWDTGSPKLRIKTDKSARHRQLSDGPPADFYSPLASFHNSPLAGEVEATTADEEQKHWQQNSSLSSGSRQEGEASRLNQARPTPEVLPSSQAVAVAEAQASNLSDVERMVAAFGNASVAQQSLGDREQSDAKKGGIAQTAPEAHSQTELGEQQLLPPEILAITAFLKSGGRLRTPGLFIKTVDMATSLKPRTPETFITSKQIRGDSQSLIRIRDSLDRGRGIPANSVPQAVAAILLAYFCSLPKPLIPEEVLNLTLRPGQNNVSREVAQRALEDTLHPTDLALLLHVLGVLRSALEDHNREANGLHSATLADLFSEVWFVMHLSKLDLHWQHVRHESSSSNLQRSAGDMSACRRSRFLASLLC